jgi:hypothetical protein
MLRGGCRPFPPGARMHRPRKVRLLSTVAAGASLACARLPMPSAGVTPDGRGRLRRVRYTVEVAQVITLHFVDQPVFNFDYMDFVRSAAP